MKEVTLRPAMKADFEAILRLNDGEVQQTSPMDGERLEELDRMSCYHKVAIVEDVVAAFLLVMRNGAPYTSENFLWFNAKYPEFMYVDRIVVSASFARHKLGTRLYSDLFEQARAERVPIITCEYNIDPPNEASRCFHDKFGFAEVGTLWGAKGTKRVSLQVAKTR